MPVSKILGYDLPAYFPKCVARWYFLVLFLPLSATAHWWCVAYWLVDAFWCFSSPFQQQGFGGSGHFGAFFYIPSHYFKDCLTRSFVLLFSCVLVLFSHLPSQELKWLGAFCWFFPSLLLRTLTRWHYILLRKGVTHHSYTKVTPLSKYILAIAMFKST